MFKDLHAFLKAKVAVNDSVLLGIGVVVVAIISGILILFYTFTQNSESTVSRL